MADDQASSEMVIVLLVLVLFLLILVFIYRHVCDTTDENVRDTLIISVVPLDIDADIIVANTAVEALIAVNQMNHICYKTVLVHGRLFTYDLAARLTADRIVVTSASYQSATHHKTVECYMPITQHKISMNCHVEYMSPSLMDLVLYAVRYFNVQIELVTVVTFRPEAYTHVRTVDNEVNARPDTQLLIWDMAYAPSSYEYKTVLLSGLQVSQLKPGIHTISQVFNNNMNMTESISGIDSTCVAATVLRPYDYGTVNIFNYMNGACGSRLITQQLTDRYLGIDGLVAYSDVPIINIQLNPGIYQISAPLGMNTTLTIDCHTNIIVDAMSVVSAQ